MTWITFNNRRDDGVYEEIVLARRKYTYERTVLTNVTPGYVPDWDLERAVAESAQNAYDEAYTTKTKVYPEHDALHLYLRDQGRGVEFNSILLIGQTDKRGVDDLVGEHGEGEIISFLVAVREGQTKVMASKDWATYAEVRDIDGYDVLVFHLYRSDKPRKGTVWWYGNTGTGGYYCDIWANVAERFKYHAYHGRIERKTGLGRLLTAGSETGRLYSNGVSVQWMWGLHFGYNLRQSPGRDRSSYSWTGIRDEVAKILAEHATSENIADLIEVSSGNGNKPNELELDIDFTERRVKLAIQKVLKRRRWKGLFYSTNRDVVAATDVVQLGCGVIRVEEEDELPSWLKDHIEHVDKVTDKLLPKTNDIVIDPRLECVLTFTFELYGVNPADITIRLVDSMGQFGGAINSSGRLTISLEDIRQSDFTELCSTINHELAHYTSGYGDGTREHTLEVSRMAAKAINNVAQHKLLAKKYTAMSEKYSEFIATLTE